MPIESRKTHQVSEEERGTDHRNFKDVCVTRFKNVGDNKNYKPSAKTE